MIGEAAALKAISVNLRIGAFWFSSMGKVGL
jgi:hypothetical protein